MRWALINDGVVVNVVDVNTTDPKEVIGLLNVENAVMSDSLNIGDAYTPTPHYEPAIEEILLTALLEIQELKQRITELEDGQ